MVCPPQFEDEEKQVSKNNQLEIKQIFTNIKLTEDFKFMKEDRLGSAYGVKFEQELKKLLIGMKFILL